MIHRTYSKLLRHHSSGHALYFPVSADLIRPGSLGYFDGSGGWHSLAYDVKSAEWPIQSFTGELRTTTHEPYRVEELTSERTGDFTAGFDGTPLAPVSVGGNIEASNHTKGLAVLQCGPITWEHLAAGVGELKTWGKDNAKNILEKETVTRDYGFFVVTGTRRTNWCKLKCWSTNDRTIATTLSAGLPYAGNQIGGKIEAKGAETLSSGWISRPADEDDQSKEFIIFVEGYLFIPRILGIVQASSERIYRDDEDENIDGNERVIEPCGTAKLEGVRNRYDIQCEIWIGMTTNLDQLTEKERIL